jgi:hypothetical protein
MFARYRHHLLYVVAILLTFAAALKFFALATRSLPFDRVTVQVLIVTIELSAAAWICSKSGPISCWISAVFLFSIFFVINVIEGWFGYTSCGCLGSAKISPWVMSGFDAIVLLGLAAASPDWFSARPMLRTAGLISGVLLLVFAAGIVTLAVVDNPKEAIAKWRIDPVSEPPLILTASNWHSSAARLFKEVRDPKLKSGQWVILLYRANCQRCAEAMDNYRRVTESKSSEIRFGVVQFDGGDEILRECPQIHVWRIESPARWIVETPLYLRLDEGKVAAASQNMADVEW